MSLQKKYKTLHPYRDGPARESGTALTKLDSLSGSMSSLG